MLNPVKKLKLNRETVRTLHVKTALRTGADSGKSASCAPPPRTAVDCPNSIGFTQGLACAGQEQSVKAHAVGSVLDVGP